MANKTVEVSKRKQIDLYHLVCTEPVHLQSPSDNTRDVSVRWLLGTKSESTDGTFSGSEAGVNTPDISLT